ncbi:carbohydrate porin, partial [Klebsiella pneumoniae]|uniref:carbohydrate porin n=1 Tax=Klebsiella pneumoniae TaxID=573 RepID=UPI00272FF7A4
AILEPGRYDIHTLNTSWQFPNIMAMTNINIYLGAYASWLDSTAAKSGNRYERYGARVRFNYFY